MANQKQKSVATGRKVAKKVSRTTMAHKVSGEVKKMAEQIVMRDPVKVKVTQIRLDEIHVDYKWNSRSSGWEKGEDKDTGESFATFAESIAEEGIRSPIEVCNNTAGNKDKKPYFLVAGFRRYAAAELAAKTNPKFETVPAINWGEMSEIERRTRNGQENVARESLKTADIAWLVLQAHKASPGTNDTELGKPLGLSQSYVSKLRRIMTELPAPVTQAWRAGAFKVVVSDMYALLGIQGGAEAQTAAWNSMIQSAEAVEQSNERDGKGQGNWLAKAKTRAEKYGKNLGILAQLKILAIKNDADWSAAIPVVLGNLGAKKTPTAKQLNGIAEMFQAGYDAGFAEILQEEEEVANPPLRSVGGGKKGK